MPNFFRFSQKRTCTGCKALRAFCILGYKVKPTTRRIGAFIIPYTKPLEPCYKPLTLSDLELSKRLIEKQKAL